MQEDPTMSRVTKEVRGLHRPHTKNSLIQPFFHVRGLQNDFRTMDWVEIAYDENAFMQQVVELLSISCHPTARVYC